MFDAVDKGAEDTDKSWRAEQARQSSLVYLHDELLQTSSGP